jgi:YggT family protein
VNGPFTEVALLLINTFVGLYVLLILLRFLLQLVRADFYNPVSQFIVKATNPPLIPLRKLIPGVGGIDVASLILAWLIQGIGMGVIYLMLSGGIPAPHYLAIWAVLAVVQTILNIYFFAIIIIVILSWVAPQSYNPAVMLLHQLTEPLLSKIRKVMPDMGMLDLSPIIAFLLIQVIEIFMRSFAQSVGLPSQLVLGL